MWSYRNTHIHTHYYSRQYLVIGEGCLIKTTFDFRLSNMLGCYLYCVTCLSNALKITYQWLLWNNVQCEINMVQFVRINVLRFFTNKLNKSPLQLQLDLNVVSVFMVPTFPDWQNFLTFQAIFSQQFFSIFSILWMFFLNWQLDPF